jgi:hypothetical protein
VIEFLVKEDIPESDIHSRLQRAYGSFCMGSSRVRQWLKHFIGGNKTSPICPILFAYELNLLRETKEKLFGLSEKIEVCQ